MKRLISIISLFTICFLSIYSQAEVQLWRNDYSNSAMCSRDCPVDQVLTEDSVLYVTGYTERNFSNFDVTTLAFDRSGDTIWKRTFSTYEKDFSYDKPKKICTDKSGDVFILGHRSIDYRNMAMFLLKYDKNGILIWSDTTSNVLVSGILTTLVGANIIADNDGNLYVFFRHADNFPGKNNIIRKYDPDGKILWTKYYNFQAPTIVRSDHDQNIYLIINTLYNGKYVIIKADTSGSVIWEKTLDYGEVYIKEILDASIDKNNNLYLLMDVFPSIYHFDDRQDILISEITSDGKIEWGTRHNSKNNNLDHGIAMNLFNDSILIVGIITKTPNNGLDAGFLKYDIKGNLTDSAFYDGTAHDNDYLVTFASDKHFNTYASLLSYRNESSFDVQTIKIDSDLKPVWEIKQPPLTENKRYFPLRLFLNSKNQLSSTGYINYTSNPALTYDTDIDYSINFIDTSGLTRKEFIYSDPGTSNFRSARMILDSDNNIYVSGYSQLGPDWQNDVNYFKYNYFILKYSNSGKLLWSETISNDSLALWSYVNQIKKDSIITFMGSGYSEKTKTHYTILYSYDLNGKFIRQRLLPDKYYSTNTVTDKNGNIYLYIPRYDYTYSSIIKLDGNLVPQWNYHLSEISQSDINASIQIGSDGKVYIASKDRKMTILNADGTLINEIHLDNIFSGFNDMVIDSVSNQYIAGYKSGWPNKATFAKIDNTGKILWHITDDSIESVKHILLQKKSDNLIVVGSKCSVVNCTPAVISKITSFGEISGHLTLPDVYPISAISDNNDFLCVANKSDFFIVVSPDLDLLYQSTRIDDSIIFEYSLSDIKIDSNRNIFITGTFGNEVYLHSNEWKVLTTVKYKRLDTKPFIRNFKYYYRVVPPDTYSVDVSIVDLEGDPFIVSSDEFPEWIHFDNVNSKIIFTPDSANFGTYTVPFRISDFAGNSSTYQMNIKVGNVAPVFKSSPPLTVQFQKDYIYYPQAIDADNDSLFFELIEGPDWLHITEQGNLEGKPYLNDKGPFHVVLMVKDHFGGRAIQDYNVEINPLTSINEIVAGESEYLIYPNPADNFIHLLPKNRSLRSMTVNLTDNTGRIVFSRNYVTVKEESITIDVSMMTSGIYFLKIKEPDHEFLFKVLIK